MGLFTRKKATPAKRTSVRVTTSGEAEVAELRVRARRRLLGALVLVVAAIIIVPQVFDEQSNYQEQTPIVMPANVPSRTDPNLDLVASQPNLPETDPQPFSSIEEATTALQADPNQTSTTEEPTVAQQSQQETETVTKIPKSDTNPAKPAQPPTNTRTDDGKLALALLEGREPESIATNSAGQNRKGNFVLQIAAYSTEVDANARRDKLIESGVTNAYVEKTTSSAGTAYRLRVGSFSSSDSAQAAQARLRALGYDNTLLITQ